MLSITEGYILDLGEILIPFIDDPAFNLFCFIVCILGAKKVREQRRNEAHNGHQFEVRAGFSESLMDFPRATWMLIRNPAFMCVSMITVTETFSLASIAVFGPKYLESQFNMTSGAAAITAGIYVNLSDLRRMTYRPTTLVGLCQIY